MGFRNAIIIGMLAFVGFILTLVFVINSKGAELTSEEYYLNEKKFDSELEARERAKELKFPLKIELKDQSIEFSSDDNSKVSNLQIEFTRLNDKSLDRTFDFKELPFSIPTKILKQGNYLVKSSFSFDHQKLEQDTSLTIK
jgi:hypothetical protein